MSSQPPSPDPANPPDPQDLPRAWGRYTLHRLLGSGGTGIVYGATLHGRGGFEKPVALKVLRAGRTGAFLLEEARLGAHLHHPSIVETYDVGVEQGQVYLALEWVRGPTLVRAMRQGPIRLDVGVEVILQLCLALDHAHRLEVGGRPADLVHLDVKPHNVLLDPLGVAKLTDFGIARARGFTTHDQRPGRVAGTVGYLAPEALVGEPIDARADVFAVGTLLGELALGRKLWSDRGWRPYLAAVRNTDRTLADRGLTRDLDRVAPGLAAVVAGAVRTDPDERTPDLRALHDALRLVHPGGGNLAALVARVIGGDPRFAARATPAPASDEDPTLRRTNLTDGAELVGRGAEQNDLETRLSAPGLVTIFGPGGIGKTSLARAAGARMLARFDGGVWFVDLAPVTTLTALIDSVCRALAIAPHARSTPDRIDAIGAALAAWGRTLVILDNLEQLVEVAGEPLLAWLRAAPELTLAATSQRRLDLPGEQLITLGGLDRADGITLFRQRAAALGIGAVPADDPAIGPLIDSLDGLPLAIELAAARTRTLSCAQILAAMADPRPLLVDRSGHRPARHRTLERAVAWSWGLLVAWQQSALRQLSVFRNTFTVEMAQEVLDLTPYPDAPWTLFAIEDLLDRSLLSLVPGPEPGFRILIAIRNFAEARLHETPGELATVIRHGRLVAAHGTRERIHARYGPDAPAAWSALLRDAEDIAWALEQALERGDTEIAYYTCRAWCDVQDRTGTSRSQLPTIERVLAMTDLAPLSRLGMLHQLAQAANRGGVHDTQERALTEGLARAEAADHAGWKGVFVAGLAEVASRKGDFAAAVARTREAIDSARMAGDHLNETIHHANLALRIRCQGRLDAALGALVTAAELAEVRGNLILLGHMALNRGLTLLHLGRLDEAKPELERALGANTEQRQHLFVIECHLWLARLAGVQGDEAAAREHIRVALDLARSRGEPARLGVTLTEAARLLAPLDAARALRLVDEAQALGHGGEAVPPMFLLARAVARFESGDLGGARIDVDASMAARGSAEAMAQATIQAWRARIRAAAGDAEGAATDRRSVLEAAQQMGLGPAAPLRALLPGPRANQPQ